MGACQLRGRFLELGFQGLELVFTQIGELLCVTTVELRDKMFQFTFIRSMI